MITSSLIEQVRNFDTTLLANTIERIDTTPVHEWYLRGGIQSVTPELGPTVGIAYTCELDSSTPGGLPDVDAYWAQIEHSELPVVWVVKTTGSRPEHECVLGDGMAKLLYSVGCIGVVTDGGVRDVRGLAAVPFAAYARGKTVHHCALRFQHTNHPVEIGGITISPVDLLHAGSEGVIRIPRTCLAQLPEKACQVEAFEREAHDWLRRTDITPAEKRQRVGELAVKYGLNGK